MSHALLIAACNSRNVVTDMLPAVAKVIDEESGLQSGGIPVPHPHCVSERWGQPHAGHLRDWRAVVMWARPSWAAGSGRL